ncbi:NAD(P)-dependent oxidoreductase [Sinomonas sp. ASV486]|uniref:NAD(P)-dependent oxidoreductase n=1 Tax=Sinomonas sp. ASV486 TaxID=3051170 RepID=UPI0027DC9983|nr:NAD(P)-dependent oxidoreductase [Sinomonas sp. ASV486]MDQ4489793.1 NAD(P)-dependent oxidoreductase [Sinomonas sp. ASV486]
MQRPVGISRDFLDPGGNNVWGDIGLAGLDEAGIPWEYLPEDLPELTPEQVDGRPAVIFANPAVTARTFDGVAEPPLVLARFGVGYDSVDLDACTANGVAATITPDGARRPVATAALTMILASFHNLIAKDRIIRRGDWDRRTEWMGRGLTGRTVGLIGLGNTSTDLVELLRPFQTKVLAYDPYCPAQRATDLGVELVGLDDLAAGADVVVVMTVLTDETRHLVSTSFLNRMKATAHLVNVSRGPIVDEAALTDALRNGTITAAALDVFESEPVAAQNPLLDMDNVILTPHSVAWTDEMSLGNGSSAVQAVIDALNGTAPKYVVNRPVLEQEAFLGRLRSQTKVKQ